MAGTHDFTIEQGATFDPRLLYSQPTFVVKPITGITKSGRAVVSSVHGLGQDWSVYVTGVVGMDKINHKSDDLNIPAKAYLARFIDAGSLQLEVDSSRFGAYVSGGELVYHPPMDLTGHTARMHIRDEIDSTTALVTLTTENGGITLGGTAGTIDLLITATATALLDFAAAVYDLEIINGASRVTRLLSGNIYFSEESTR